MPKKSVVLLLAFLAGCGTQISFKQGGDAGGFSAADRACRTSNKIYEQCMQAAGWSVHKMHTPSLELNPLATLSTSDNQTGAITATTPAPTTPKDPKGKPISPSPDDKFNVAAWGKMGGTAESLKADTATCAEQLGPAHRPDPESPLMTRALVMCLKDKGWSGLQGY